MHEKEATWTFLLENAQNLAERYGTTPEELVLSACLGLLLIFNVDLLGILLRLVTETSGYIESEPFEDLNESLTRPIYCYLHFSLEGHINEAYWSFEDTPGSRICEEDYEELGLPDVER